MKRRRARPGSSSLRALFRPAPSREAIARKAVVRQLDESDCGAACLGWVARYFGGGESAERLRALSGTSADGVTLLGIHQAAMSIGLESSAFRAGVSDLIDLDSPCILHILIQGRRPHFVVHFGKEGAKHIIGDPAIGILRITDAELDGCWASKALLALRPGPQFVLASQRRADMWRWLALAVRRDIQTLIVAFVAGAILSVMSLALAVFSKELIDDILPRQDVTKLAVGLGMLMLVFGVQAAIAAARQAFLLRQARDFSLRITDRFLQNLVGLPFSFFSTRKTGDLVARLDDTERLQQFVTHVVGSMLIQVLMIMVGWTYIFSQSELIAVGLMGALSVFGVTAWRFQAPIIKGQQLVMSAHSLTKSGYVEAIRGIETIKVSHAESVFMSLMRDTFTSMQDEIYKLGRVAIRYGVRLEMTGSFITVGVLGSISYFVITEQMGVGALVAVLQMTGMVVPAARNLATSTMDLQEARVAFNRIYQLTSLPPETLAEAEAGLARLEGVRRLDVRSVTFRFPGQPELLLDASLRCQLGEILLITGPTGSGKSSLLRLLERLVTPEDGHILVNGCDWSEFSLQSWRRMLAVVPQHVAVFSGTVLDNILFGRTDEPANVIESCRRFGLGRFFERLPAGYQTHVGEGGMALSGGQRQLLGLARALTREAPVLLLDEPTAAMDGETAQSVVDIITSGRDGRLTIVASHQALFEPPADRVYCLNEGRLTLEMDRSEDRKVANL